ncbi:hypothetical protein KKF05_03200 [Patescibacteria group bacterium]|nr:hypothetical protein [Patescibacteria group bacterium]MBU1028862.1 hypothetical protein [Patescibacteria group bacterium]MBU1915767.1 hypothetical protein [Patescibacteria group bacterium]
MNELETITSEEVGTGRLAEEVARVADVLEKQNKLSRRLFLGIVFGVGTAIGASIIASILILAFSRIMTAVGLDTLVDSNQLKNLVEHQLEQQTPQE